MKFSREFPTEGEARARETALQLSGYRAWCTRKTDGTWEVFWWVEVNLGARTASCTAA